MALTIGGFAAAEGVYRSKSELADIGSSFAKIPFANNVLNHVEETRGTARQSRLSLLAEGDINPDTHAAFYTELDFLAGAQTGNSNESNSFSPRIRNVYGTLDWDHVDGIANVHLLAGQNWSLATMNTKGITPRNELPPPTIDAQYVVGFAWARQPQVRLTADFIDKQLWVAVSAENPATTLASAATGTGTTASGITATTGGTSTSQFDNTNTITFNHVPDVIAKVAFEPNLFGSRPLHMEVYGIYRDFYDRVNVATINALGLPAGINNQDTSSGGVGGGITWTAIPKLLDLEASALTGRGIGRYGSGQLPDAVVGPDGKLKPITETMFMAGATLHATPPIDLYFFGGEEHANRLGYHTVGAEPFRLRQRIRQSDQLFGRGRFLHPRHAADDPADRRLLGQALSRQLRFGQVRGPVFLPHRADGLLRRDRRTTEDQRQHGLHQLPLLSVLVERPFPDGRGARQAGGPFGELGRVASAGGFRQGGQAPRPCPPRPRNETTPSPQS